MTNGARQAADNQAIRQSLARAGIPSSFHDTRLADLGPTGEEAAQWLGETGAEFMKGGVINVVSRTGRGREFAFVLARGFHLKGRRVRVTNIAEVIRLASQGGSDRLEELEQAHVLLITSFMSDIPSKESPMSGYQTVSVQEFIMDQLLNDVGLIVSSTCSFLRFSGKTWWSPEFIATISKRKKEWVIE